MRHRFLQQPHIILIGMMGCGKSSVGRAVARHKNWKFIDTDIWIQEIAGSTIAEIFTQHGEPEFRRLEHEAVKHVCSLGRLVVATGGGIIEHETNRTRIWKQGVVFYLKASVPVLFERVMRNQKRPLLQKENPRQILENLLARREPLYTQAHFTIEVDKLNVKQIASRVWSLYESRA